VLAEPELPAGVALHDLGEHRLKDLRRPEHLWQLVLPDLPGLRAEFPPLRSLDAHPHNLPLQPTPLVGREREVAAVCALLRREHVRLVTLTGVGGVGKTRLALQVAAELVDDFPDGTRFVGMSRLVDPTLVVPTIAQTLGLREAGGQPIYLTLGDSLHDKQVLLVLDNCEQVVAAATEVAGLLATCAGLKVLATSRVVLHLRGEKQVRVGPLPLPDPGHLPPPEHLVQYPAVALFVQRAHDTDAAFALTNATALAIAAICARLDGLPLAIELAAVKVGVLPPPALLARLERQLPLLVGGARDVEARQQTMRATLAWSEGLLSPAEQRLFHRLAVFVGGFTLEAAEAVCAAPEAAEPLGVDVLDGLERLVDQSLVLPWTVGGADGAREEEGAGKGAKAGERAGEARFRLLHVVREYALDRLEASGDAEALRRAHAVYSLRLAEQAKPEIRGPAQVAWLDQLEREHDNFRAALAWACSREAGRVADRVEFGLQLAAALARFWRARGHFSQGRSWLEELLHATAPSVPTEVRLLSEKGNEELRATVPAAVWARAANALGWLSLWQGTHAPAAAWLEAAAIVARAAGDRRTAADALHGLGVLAFQRWDQGQAAARLEESLMLAREAGDSSDLST
jgi:predicted ATPase